MQNLVLEGIVLVRCLKQLSQITISTMGYYLSIPNNANLLCCHSPQKETYGANLQILVKERVLLQTDQTER